MCVLHFVNLQRDLFPYVEVINTSKEEEEEIHQFFFSCINYRWNRYEF